VIDDEEDEPMSSIHQNNKTLERQETESHLMCDVDEEDFGSKLQSLTALDDSDLPLPRPSDGQTSNLHAASGSPRNNLNTNSIPKV
jgi:hypothetical protein